MISVIVCSINPINFTRVCAAYRELLAGEPFEIIGIHDANALAEAYNRGLDRSRGDTVIFSHDDIEIWTPDFLPRLKAHLQQFDVVGIAGTRRLVSPGWHGAGPPYIYGQITHPLNKEFQVAFYGGHGHRIVGGIQAMDGVLLAFRRDVIQRIRWDEQHFTGFHCYDVDCTYRAYKAGYKLGVALDLPMLHSSGGNFGDAWKIHAAMFLQLHGSTLATVSPRLAFRDSVVQVDTAAEAQVLMHAFYQLPS